MTWAVISATDAHALYLAPRLTEADAAEVWGMAQLRPYDALSLSARHSLFAYTWVVDDEPACMYGVSADGLLDPVGHPWMLGSDLVRRHRVTFLRHYRDHLDRLLAWFPTLETFVDARHTVCLRWLKWTGFTIGPAEPIGANGLPCHRVRLPR